jgi:hypothetical protein
MSRPEMLPLLLPLMRMRRSERIKTLLAWRNRAVVLVKKEFIEWMFGSPLSRWVHWNRRREIIFECWMLGGLFIMGLTLFSC